MPRVGSSSTSNDGDASIHLAMTIFCWLPPDEVPTGCSTDSATTPSCRQRSIAAFVRRSLRRTKPSLPSVNARTLTTFSAILWRSISPCCLRSAGPYAIPALTASAVSEGNGTPDGSIILPDIGFASRTALQIAPPRRHRRARQRRRSHPAILQDCR